MSLRTAFLLLALSAAPLAFAQDFNTDVHTKASPEAPARAAANAALEAHDYARALTLLQPLAAANPKDPHILYDLASSQDALDQSAAESTYKQAIAADPTFLDPHVALGLLLARAGRFPEARAEFVSATSLPTSNAPLKARAFRSLARLDQTTRPADARDELLEALKLSPETTEDTLLAAELAASAGNGAPAAEAEYRRVLAAHPADPEATAALARLLVKTNHPDQAQALLTTGLAAHPADPAMTVQLASLYAAQGKSAEALPLVEALASAHPQDPNIARVLAGLYVDAHEDAKAEPILATLISHSPHDTGLIDDRARALIHLHRDAEAQALLAPIVAQPTLFPTPTALGDAAGDLAFAASANHDPEACLQALAIRATVLPPSAPVLFLTAISHDKLHHVKLARKAYQEFLAESKGALPDEEFEARHRLVALEHMQ